MPERIDVKKRACSRITVKISLSGSWADTEFIVDAVIAVKADGDVETLDLRIWGLLHRHKAGSGRQGRE